MELCGRSEVIPRTSWEQRTTSVCGWSTVISKPAVVGGKRNGGLRLIAAAFGPFEVRGRLPLQTLLTERLQHHRLQRQQLLHLLLEHLEEKKIRVTIISAHL